MKRSETSPTLLKAFEAYCFDVSADFKDENLFQAWLNGYLLGYATRDVELTASGAKYLDAP